MYSGSPGREQLEDLGDRVTGTRHDFWDSEGSSWHQERGQSVLVKCADEEQVLNIRPGNSGQITGGTGKKNLPRKSKKVVGDMVSSQLKVMAY